MNEKYKLNKEWLDLLLEHKNNANVTFNLSNNDTRILLTYIEVLQQENARLKDKNKKVLELLQILHYNFPDYDEMHKKVEDIEEILKEN